MDGFVRRRLRSILRKYQKKGGGTGRNIQDHQQWTNAYFVSLGLFTMYEAHAEASPTPMRKISKGVPRAGEPHARFGGRGESERLFFTPR
jgi:hypothetical protein